MELIKRPESPYWVLHTTHPVTRKRHRVSTGCKAKGPARDEALRIMEQLSKLVDASGIPMLSLCDALGRYVASLESQGKASAPGQAALRDKALGIGSFARLRRHRLEGTMPLQDLDAKDLDALVMARRREGNGPQTIGHELKLLRAASRHATGLGFKPPALLSPGMKNPWRIPACPIKTRYLSREEWQAVFNHLDPDRPVTMGRRGKTLATPYGVSATARGHRVDARDLLVALTLTGGRWGEVAALTWDRVDLVAGTVKLFGTKNEQERLVPLPGQLRETLSRRLKEGRGGPYVFPGYTDTRHTHEASTQALHTVRDGCDPIRRAMDAVGLNRPDIVARYGTATIHSLRHTFASWVLQAGADLSEVRDALGHSTLQMTLRYAALAKAKTATKLGGLLDQMGA